MKQSKLASRIACIAIALLTTLAIVTPTTASAAVNINVSSHVCYEMANIAPGSWGAGVNYTFTSHNSLSVQLTTRYSWGWVRDARGQVPMFPSVVRNQYHVRMLDWNGRVVWQELNAIPNGGSRTFGVGSNVRQIQVIANTYYWGWTVGPGVGFSS